VSDLRVFKKNNDSSGIQSAPGAQARRAENELKGDTAKTAARYHCSSRQSNSFLEFQTINVHAYIKMCSTACRAAPYWFSPLKTFLKS